MLPLILLSIGGCGVEAPQYENVANENFDTTNVINDTFTDRLPCVSDALLSDDSFILDGSDMQYSFRNNSLFIFSNDLIFKHIIETDRRDTLLMTDKCIAMFRSNYFRDSIKYDQKDSVRQIAQIRDDTIFMYHVVNIDLLVNEIQ